MSGYAGSVGDSVGRAVERFRARTGVDVAFAGPCPDAGDRLVISYLSGTSTRVLAGLTVVAGTGVGGKAIATRRPVRVVDYVAASAISHEYDRAVTTEGVRAVFAVPVLAGRGVAAVLYGALRRPSDFGDGILTSACDAARDAGREIAVAREVEQRMAQAAELPGWAALEIRLAYADLLALAGAATDPGLGERLREVCGRLARTAGAGADTSGGLADEARGVGRGRTVRMVRLTPRETDVLALVAVGRTNAEVGQALGLGAETVKSYLRAAMRKLGAHNRVEAVVAARAGGYLP
ncbi:LuxR C-terminal-related transcriptional regulator [Embleya scabrispora]|uniref:LuxR C-terminal-related transcriptional regulator n=1 Tax=Embleya scabrispora TaxID=159449 RepID=UPI000380E51B|nr:LuxR C-terminal-related transcriptional regulator [Embleya scabrispora]MYS81120.1 GAF domain-containing protein [Streptomyces sp. SID5474]